jgi:hypothetical protein
MYYTDIHAFRHKAMQKSISNYAEFLKSQNLIKSDYYQKLYNYIYRWREIKESSSINAIDSRIRKSASEDLEYLDLVLSGMSKLVS